MLDTNDISNNPTAFDKMPTYKQKRLCNWIRRNLLPIKTFNYSRTSHDLMLLYEEQTGRDENNCITIGEFKGAMLKAGFRVKNETSAKWIFNVSENSPAFKK